jgi:uncharacterized protein (TIGR00290 family)
MTPVRALVAWSSGKDSAWTLHALQRDPGVEVVGLLTTTTRAFDRVAMHGVRRSLLGSQARATGLPLWEVPIPTPCSNDEYAAAMRETLARARREGIEAVAFGDLFLEDVRRYREEQMRETGLQPLFPLWGQPTRELAEEMIAGGLRAVIACVDPRQIPAGLAGREFDRAFLEELPDGADRCGERGEFHSFVTHGPMLRAPVPVRRGDVVERDGFVFADLLPEGIEDAVA